MTSTTATEDQLPNLPTQKKPGLFRPARALIGWLPPESAHELLLLGREDPTVTPEIVAHARSTRDFAAARTPVLQAGIVGAPPKGIGDHLAVLRQNTKNLFDEGFRVCTVDLSRLYAIQPTTFIDHREEEIQALNPADMRGAAVTLPNVIEVAMAVAADPLQKTITLASPDLNLQVLGLQTQPSQDGSCMMSFQAGAMRSILQVAHFDGRYFCRDGHTRAVQLLRHGIKVVPALVRDFGTYAEIAQAPNLLPDPIALGSNPPTIADFLDDRVSAAVSLNMTRKVVVVSAKEIAVPV